MRVGIDVVQADPGAELAERRGEVEEAGPHLALAPEARRVFEVDAVGAGVLRDDEDLLDARLHETLGLAQHVAGRAADEIAAQLRDDAERAAVVAALGNLQVGVVPGRELDALRRHEVEIRVVRRRRRRVHGRDDALVGLRPGDREHVGEALADLAGLRAHAAGDDDLAVLGHRLADGAERFRLGAVEEAAGVDDDEIGAGMRLGQLVALGAELRDDALGIDEGLRAAERHEGDLGSGRVHAKKVSRGAPRAAARHTVGEGQIGAFDAKSTSISWRTRRVRGAARLSRGTILQNRWTPLGRRQGGVARCAERHRPPHHVRTGADGDRLAGRAPEETPLGRAGGPEHEVDEQRKT